MPKLSEVIGALLADAAQARVRADLETVRIAEAYSQHDLLKHLPVPRFRLPELIVDLPVLVVAVEGRPEDGSGIFGQPTPTEITQTIREGLKQSGLRLPRNGAARVSEAVIARVKELFTTSSSPTDPDRITQVLTETVVASIKELMAGDFTEEQFKAIQSAISPMIRKLLSAKLLPAEFVEVVATASEIKAHGDNDSVLRLRLTINEEAYEAVARDDRPGYYLTPE